MYFSSSLLGYVKMQGHLIYTDGGKNIRVLDLSSPQTHNEAIYQGAANVSVSVIGTLTKVNNDIFIFDERPVTGKSMIRKYSFQNKSVLPLYPGILPCYMSKYGKLLFYETSGNNSGWLLLSDLDGNKESIKKIATEPEKKLLANGIRISTTTLIIPISTDEVVFYGEKDQLWRYNLFESELIATGIKNCKPLVWRDKTKQLLCRDWDSSEVFLIDINTKSKISLRKLKDAYGFVYIEKADSLVYGRTKSRFPFGERYDIYLYSINDENEKVIESNSHIAGGIWMW